MKTEIVIYITGLYSNYLLELKGTSKIEGPEMRTYLHAVWIVCSALHQLACAVVWEDEDGGGGGGGRVVATVVGATGVPDDGLGIGDDALTCVFDDKIIGTVGC